MNRVTRAVFAVAVGAGAGAVFGDISYVSQARSVTCSTRAFTQQCDDMATAPNFGVFNETIDCRSEAAQGGLSVASAVLRSELLPDRITATGSTSGNWQPGQGSLGSYGNDGYLNLSVVFTVPRESDYRLVLDYQLGSQPFPPPGPFVTLSGPAGFTNLSYTATATTADITGAMPAGEYRLFARIGRGTSFPVIDFAASLALDLQVDSGPCPADFNGDGSATSQDFFDFLTAFFSLEGAADVNSDGVVDSQDFFEFLPAFFAGC